MRRGRPADGEADEDRHPRPSLRTYSALLSRAELGRSHSGSPLGPGRNRSASNSSRERPMMRRYSSFANCTVPSLLMNRMPMGASRANRWKRVASASMALIRSCSASRFIPRADMRLARSTRRCLGSSERPGYAAGEPRREARMALPHAAAECRSPCIAGAAASPGGRRGRGADPSRGDAAARRRREPAAPAAHGAVDRGTIPYFMSEEGGIVDRRRIFAERLPQGFKYAASAATTRTGSRGCTRRFRPNGMGVIIAPIASRVHLSFAVNAPQVRAVRDRPALRLDLGRPPVGDWERRCPRCSTARRARRWTSTPW